MTEADLSGADLSEAVLSGANLKAASLIKAKIDRTRLNGATLQGVDMSGAHLLPRVADGAMTGTDLHGARYDCWTLWPSGFQPPEVTILEGSKLCVDF